MSFSQKENGAIDELIVEKIMARLIERSPLTKRVYESEFRQIVALVRLSEQDMKSIEKHMEEHGFIRRRGKAIYFKE